jgi:hypothetical protein
MNKKIVAPPHTRIYNDGHHTLAEFRDRELIKVSYSDIRLDMHGHRDVITQARLNQIARLLHLDVHVRRQDGIWLLETPQEVYLYQDGMHLFRSTGRDHEWVRYEGKLPR